jgi:hypothetical protein
VVGGKKSRHVKSNLGVHECLQTLNTLHCLSSPSG